MYGSAKRLSSVGNATYAVWHTFHKLGTPPALVLAQRDHVEEMVRIDNEAGSASGDWGSLSYPKVKTVTTYLNAGYQFEVCVKSGTNVNDGWAEIYNVTPEIVDCRPTAQTITIAQDISHTGWRLVPTSTPPLSPLLPSSL